MKKYTTSQDYTTNINTATELINDLGVQGFSFASCSIGNFGVSVYFTDLQGNKIRVSDHSVSNTHRMQNEFHFSFDAKTLRGIESRFERNKLMFNSYFGN